MENDVGLNSLLLYKLRAPTWLSPQHQVFNYDVGNVGWGIPPMMPIHNVNVKVH